MAGMGPMDGGALLMTGVTGFVGGELLARALERSSRPIVALVRAADDREAQRRIDETVTTLVPGAGRYAGRVEGLAAASSSRASAWRHTRARALPATSK